MEPKLLEHVERSADLATSWRRQLDRDDSSIFDQHVFSDVIEYLTVVMPESFIPSPSDMSESLL